VIFAAIPAYDGKLHVETARSLLNEQVAALASGVELHVAFLPGCSLITHARNQLVQDFLDSGAERLVFIDSDVAWEPGDVLKLASYPVDVVGGAYRFKSADENYPVTWAATGFVETNEHELLEVGGLPGGFLAISRDAALRLREAFPDRGYAHFGRQYHGYFHAPIGNGHMFGEDAAFCHDWRSIGGQVWLAPEFKLTHVGGVSRYEGRIGDWLRSRAPAAPETSSAA